MTKVILVLPVLLLLAIASCGQNNNSALNSLAGKFPREKAYIHYDKEFYVAGETIWFKAYLYSNGKPSALSNNFYLQLIDDKGNVISRKQYPVKGSTVSGNIEIPEALAQGYYHIDALTPAMLNTHEGAIYSKNIFVFSPLTKQQEGIKTFAKDLPVAAVQFFPESGQLVDGILTTVAFEAVDSLGQPVNINGVIKTEDGVDIVSFRTLHAGIGRVQFRPQAEKKYIAIVNNNDRSTIYPLPAVHSSGINLKIENEKGGKMLLLTRGNKEKENFDKLFLVVQINNSIIYENQIRLVDYQSAKRHLLTDSLPSGILLFTVFNKDGMPLAERMTFVNNDTGKNADSIAVIKKGTGTRQENIFEINFPDAIQRSCSVSVTDLEEQPFPGNENIRTKLLLTDELKGYIFNPGYYFQSQDDSVQTALDNLMLTHGWSGFTWTPISANEFPEKKYTDNYLVTVSGVVLNEKDKKPVAGGKLNVFLADEDSALFSYAIPVTESGKFIIDSLIIYGKTKIYYTYIDKKEKERAADIVADNNVLPYGITERLSTIPEEFPGTYQPSLKEEEINRRYAFIKPGNPEAKILENVTLKTARKRPVDIVNEKYTSDIFRTGGRVVIDNINNPPVDKSMNGFDYVKNRIFTVDTQYGTFVNSKNFSLLNRDDPKSGVLRHWEVGLFINEMQADILQLKLLRADKIAMVKFFEAGAIAAGSEFPGGAIAVYLKQDAGVPELVKKSRYLEYDGYSITKEFYSPDYTAALTNQGKTDNRTTLYWNPEIYTDDTTTTIKIRFFNNDRSRQFRVVVEGFDARGRLISIEKEIGD